jgi:protein-S-isoprenylcysteine O-methyltransferase Ste14
MPREPSKLVRFLADLNTSLGTEFLGGPKVIKLAWVVNFQKGLTLPFVLGLMAYYGNFSPAAWVYLALHGSYGIVWLLKHYTMPDPNWERRVTVGGAVMSFALVLGPYWSFPFLLVSNVLPRHEPSLALMAGAAVVHTLGVTIMMVADAQKYFTLRVKRGLITDGMFRYVRHPNYLGEMMLYGAYALLVGHWVPWAVLAWVWLALFRTNMIMKEASMSRYADWAAYEARTGMLLPRLFAAGAQRAEPKARVKS